MAHIASNNNGNTNLPNRIPFMDPLTHSVIKETSKSLRYYLDVKRRENAFVLSSSSASLDPIPHKARFIYGTTKEYPPLYGSFHSDNDVKVYLRSFQQQQRQPHSTSASPEKQMCRDELTFHMREQKYPSKENHKFGELRLGTSNRSTSSCSRSDSPEYRQRLPRTAFKPSRRARDQLVDDTADILATMIKSRRSIYQANYLSQQIPADYVSQNANPSPREFDDQHHIPTTDLKTSEKPPKQKRSAKNALEQALSDMHNAKPIDGNSLICDYKVSVTTGNCNGASTNAPIRIKFYGTKGYTEFSDLVDSEEHRVPFLKGNTDVFTIRTGHVGGLIGITIGHQEKDIRSAWFLEKVSIDDPIRERTHIILCNSWLSSKSNDQKTMRDFPIISLASDRKEHREENDNQSSSSARLRRTSNTTNGSQNDQLNGHKQTKGRAKKQERIGAGEFVACSIEPNMLKTEITNNRPRPPSPTTFKSNNNQREFVSSSVPKRYAPSPVISSSSSDTEIEENIDNRSHSISPTPSPTRSTGDRIPSRTPDSVTHDLYKHHLTDDTRPPARLKNRSPSPERPIKSREEKNEDDAHDFFE